MKFRMGGGSLLGIAVAVLVAVIAAFNWLGQHSAQIGAGVGVLLRLAAMAAVLWGAGALAWHLRQARQPREQVPDAAPPPVRVASEQVPLPGADDETLALPPGGAHYHFGDMDPGQAAELIRLLRGDDRG